MNSEIASKMKSHLGFEPDIFMKFPLNNSFGSYFSYRGSGGSVVYSRGGG